MGKAALNMGGNEDLLDQLHTILGWRPLPGTLNVFMPHPAIWESLRSCGSVGLLRVFRGSIERMGSEERSVCALLRSEDATQHRHILEVIAPRGLRLSLGLVDKTRVRVSVEER